MTEVWTGRKYRGEYTMGIYEVLSEPIEWNGKKYVSYAFGGSAVPSGHEQLTEFENRTNYTRIIEPKFAVGDRVTTDYSTYTIDAVSSKADKDGDFAYLVITHDGDVDIMWESHISGKASE